MFVYYKPTFSSLSVIQTFKILISFAILDVHYHMITSISLKGAIKFTSKILKLICVADKVNQSDRFTV